MENSSMERPRGIIVCGPNGSGKTTLGRELARILGYHHMDHEAYAFGDSAVPYTDPRTREECVELMLADMEQHRQFVLSAVTGEFGEIIPRFYALAVSISAPLALRLQRFDQREYERHGERVLVGGDLCESRMQFRDFIASRPLSEIEQWTETIACPVIRIDGTIDWRTNARALAEHYSAMGRTIAKPTE